jgi:CubicO group peptidase (beta-lactamase class C family)
MADSSIAPTRIEGRPLLFEPGSKFQHEEHSAYNLLALIVEKKTGLPFATAVDRLVFRPMGLSASGVDDDSMTHASHMAAGYEPEGTYGLRRANAIHWPAKTGNASVYTTADDKARRVDALFDPSGQGSYSDHRAQVAVTLPKFDSADEWVD